MAMNETFAGVAFNLPDDDAEKKSAVKTSGKKNGTKKVENRQKKTEGHLSVKSNRQDKTDEQVAAVKIPVPPKKITKSVHKNFLLTEEENHILETIAKQNGMSQNELIEGLIQQLKPNMK